MKMPIVLRSTFEEKVNSLNVEIDKRNEWYMDLTEEFENLKQINIVLNDRNCELNISRLREVEELKKEIENMQNKYNDLEESNIKTKWCLEESKKENSDLHRQVIINKIAKKQLKDLVVVDVTETETLIKEKVNGKKIWDLVRLL